MPYPSGTPASPLSRLRIAHAALLVLMLSGREALCAGHSIYGWVEHGWLLPHATPITMKLDSGARTSSIDGHILSHFERRSQPWIRFEVRILDRADNDVHSLIFERRIRRRVAVRGAGGLDHRPVVEMRICIGPRILSEEFSLADRSKMLYPVLLGRHAIARLGLLDVSRKFLRDPRCRTTGHRTLG